MDATLDGAPITRWDVRRVGPGVFSLLAPDGRQTLVSLHRDEERTRAHAAGALVTFDFLDELSARARETGGRRSAAVSPDVKAAIPGRVLRILVESGADVSAGQPLLVLEAMKMENEVRAPREGRIRSVEVAPGKPVAAGEILVRFEI